MECLGFGNLGAAAVTMLLRILRQAGDQALRACRTKIGRERPVPLPQVSMFATVISVMLALVRL